MVLLTIKCNLTSKGGKSTAERCVLEDISVVDNIVAVRVTDSVLTHDLSRVCVLFLSSIYFNSLPAHGASLVSQDRKNPRLIVDRISFQKALVIVIAHSNRHIRVESLHEISHGIGALSSEEKVVLDHDSENVKHTKHLGLGYFELCCHSSELEYLFLFIVRAVSERNLSKKFGVE